MEFGNLEHNTVYSIITEENSNYFKTCHCWLFACSVSDVFQQSKPHRNYKALLRLLPSCNVLYSFFDLFALSYRSKCLVESVLLYFFRNLKALSAVLISMTYIWGKRKRKMFGYRVQRRVLPCFATGWLWFRLVCGLGGVLVYWERYLFEKNRV